MADNLSEAALDYGRAFCVPVTEAGVPFDQLPPDQQACVRRVGETWAQKVEARMGAGVDSGLTPETPEVRATNVVGPTGQQVASLTFVDGAVTLCLGPADKRVCNLVGYGRDAYDAAKQVLTQLGLQVPQGD